MRLSVLLAAASAASLTIAAPADAQTRKPPYYASISAGKARMRAGPGRNYPATWLYVRPDLPIRVVDVYKEWRKVEDPGGTQGWMQANLLHERRTGFVVNGAATLYDSASTTGRVLWRAAPGVVGRITRCRGGWCWFDVRGRAGYVEQSHLWGFDPGEDVG